MCSQSTRIAPAPVGAGRFDPAPFQARLAVLNARLEELAAKPLLPPDLMEKFGPLLAACAAIAANPTGPSQP